MPFARRIRSLLLPLLWVAMVASCSGDSSTGDEANNIDSAAAGATPSSSQPGDGGDPNDPNDPNDSSNGDDGDIPTTTAGAPGEATAGEIIELRPLHTSDDLHIVDDLDREVLLRGTNVNSLGEYWQGDEDNPPTIPLTDADWDEMASRGISVIRLLITWSRVEPTRGEIDEEYLDLVDSYVTEAAAHGIYSVIDMHQDAYSAYIFTEDESECAPGSTPGKGWDGAPEWATITDGLNTCVTGDRNSSPAVVAAWNHFYDNTDGIQDRFVASWAAVAGRFAGRPEVAGFDLLNEPEVSRPAGELQPVYEQLVVDTIDAIRTAQQGAEFEHILFVEPAIAAGNPAFGLVVPNPANIGRSFTNVVAAPHNYAESISNDLDLTIESANELYISVAEGLGFPTWIGEYGFWDTSDETLALVSRYAADEDARVLGGAWWQWRQACGDPHSITWGVPAEGTVTHLHQLACPGDVDEGPTEEFLRVLGRAYPRVVPGRIDSLASDPVTGAFHMTAEADATQQGSELVVWLPSPASTHPIESTGLRDLVEHSVAGGRLVTAVVDAELFELSVDPG